jgi:hypothetical protein
VKYITTLWYILLPFGNLVVIWYISLVLVYCIKKNLATLNYYLSSDKSGDIPQERMLHTRFSNGLGSAKQFGSYGKFEKAIDFNATKKL